jgi:aminopeptidase N
VKHLLVLLFVALSTLALAQTSASRQTRANNSRSDSIDIKHIAISLLNVDYNSQSVNAFADLKCFSKVNATSYIDFDLEGPIADSVFVNGAAATFVHQASNVRVQLPATLNTGDSCQVRIYYSGHPKADPQWGGFVFSGVYAFNMGVGFISQPHTIGRYWFPCFDNFVERSTYEFFVTTSNSRKAVCNGQLLDSTINGSDVTWHWYLQENIPSYLASVAIAPYVTVRDTLIGMNGQVPVEITCLASEVNNVNGSFAQLQQSFTMLEQRFGAYQWSKVGYTLVPFTAGAMEHATNIHIGKAFIDGSLNYATLIAHELSHHWFGDLATCSTAQDMWLNEGCASYCEFLHTEYVSGAAAYLTAYRDNHYSMLGTAHINDDAYRAISPMDSNYTYSTTVYNKGADAIHTLRSYLGDSLFFASMQHYLTQHSFTHASTADLSASIATVCGTSYQHFFDGWILQPGFANFTIDSIFKQAENSNVNVQVFLRQRKHQNTNYLSKVPLRINFFKPDFSYITKIYTLDAQCAGPIFNLDFDPVMIVLDQNDALSDASTWESRTIKTTSSSWVQYTQAKARVKVTAIANTTDSSLLRIEHHWVHPDRFRVPQGDYVLHDARYWRVDGINLQNLSGFLNFAYNASSTNSYLDSSWLQGNESDIRLFYRANAQQDWSFADDSLIAGAPSDRIGQIYSKKILAGDYALGIRRSGYTDPIVSDATSLPCDNVLKLEPESNNAKPVYFIVSPNPADSFIEVQLKNSQCDLCSLVLSQDGKILQQYLTGSVSTFRLDTSRLAPGTYQISFIKNQKTLQAQQLIIR